VNRAERSSSAVLKIKSGDEAVKNTYASKLEEESDVVEYEM